MTKDKYKISLWEDYFVSESGNVPAHYEEREIAVIGSDSMTTDCRAVEPKLVENINGTSTLTFKMFYVYTDDHGEKYQNPFLNLLVNERKIKTLWKGKWYDLVIKNCQENSDDRSITYTCTDLFINELSKTGFDIELDPELNNNQGTAVELAQKVLEGTDWVVNVGESDNIQQTKEEPVYTVTLTKSLENIKNETSGGTATISQGAEILVYYDQVQEFINSSVDTGSLNLQFAYAQYYIKDASSQLVMNASCYRIENSEGVERYTWHRNTQSDSPFILLACDGVEFARIKYTKDLSSEYRCSRLVKNQVSVYDSLTEKYCEVYTATSSTSDFDEGDKIYGYRTVEYFAPDYVGNLVTNAKNFTSLAGWTGDSSQDFVRSIYPALPTDSVDTNFNSKVYMRINKGTVDNAIKSSVGQYAPDGFAKGEKYIFRYKALRGRTDQTRPNDGAANPKYVKEDNRDVVEGGEWGKYTITPTFVDSKNKSYFTLDTSFGDNGIYRDDVNNWVERRFICSGSITRDKILSDDLHLHISVARAGTQSAKGAIWLEEAQFFREAYGVDVEGNTIRINPEEIGTLAISQIYYTYYNHTRSDGLVDAKYIEPIYRGTEQVVPAGLTADYNDNFEKIRSISIKQSNRFNILQTIAETFECWIRFNIAHDATGKTIYINGVPSKTVTIVKDIGKEVGVGFVYGIDLQSIQRTIQSDQIVTKTIVVSNNNEFATNGMCTIARSVENYPRVEFILNFDYYVSQGLIDRTQLNKDLYLPTEGIGYYYHLNRLNQEYDSYIEVRARKDNERTKNKALLTTYSAASKTALEGYEEEKSQLMSLANASTWSAAQTYIDSHSDVAEIATHSQKMAAYDASRKISDEACENLNSLIAKLDEQIAEYDAQQETLLDDMKALHLQFYKRYSRFLQEGSWTSEDYIDDNLYYLDALSVAYTSSRPQISYNISVLRLSGLEEFKNKVFRLGDISFIQDTEFFGYTYLEGKRSPYKEKVLVSEIVSNFDDPSKDTITVQNYKTQFEDLFQRITSTTQSLQYASGEYARAASIVEPNGTISAAALQNSLTYNEELVFSAQNESVLIDSTGITLTDTTDSSKKIKLTSGGIILSSDGGVTWQSGITAGGLNTQGLTAGIIYSDQISIMDGLYQSFRWDKNGLTAYDGNGNYLNTQKFIRLDHFGLYGVDFSSASDPELVDFIPLSESDIWNFPYTNFGFTWNKFFLKNKYGDHYVEISSTDDIRVVDASDSSEIDLIKIGKLEEGAEGQDDVYGIRLRDSQGNTTLRTDNGGNLWLDNKLSVSTTSSGNYSVEIGYSSNYKTVNGVNIHEIMHAGVVNQPDMQFIVYEDGSIKATYGQIGDLSIEAIEAGIASIAENTYKVVVSAPSTGTVFVDSNPINLVAHLYSGDSEIPSGNIDSYKWYCNGVAVAGASSASISAYASPIDISTYVYTCEITFTPPQEV